MGAQLTGLVVICDKTATTAYTAIKQDYLMSQNYLNFPRPTLPLARQLV